MKKLTTIITAIALTIFGFSLIPANTYAVSICEQKGVSEEVLRANGCPNHGDPADLSNVIIGIINGIVGSLGLVAVIVIVIGGVNYMTSAGDAGKVEKAKKTILYAAVGLIICVLAFAIVNFVIGNILGNNSASSEDENSIQEPIKGGGPA